MKLSRFYAQREGDEMDLILVVDDDPAALEVIANLLNKEGYKVDTAENGADALNKMKDKYYSLVLVDRRLPDIDGVDLLKQIEDTDPKMRKVIFTGYPSLENVQEAMTIGAHAYLTKPVEPQKILKTVKRQLEIRQKEFEERYPSLKKES